MGCFIVGTVILANENHKMKMSIKIATPQMAYFLHERISVTRERIRNSGNRVDPMGRQKGKIKILKEENM